MITVGIRNLKNSLSQYIAMAKSGKKIYITDHNTIVAEIIPSSINESNSNLLNNYLKIQAESGTLIRAKSKIHLKKEKSNLSKENKVLLKKIYSETRSDR